MDDYTLLFILGISIIITLLFVGIDSNSISHQILINIIPMVAIIGIGGMPTQLLTMYNWESKLP